MFDVRSIQNLRTPRAHAGVIDRPRELTSTDGELDRLTMRLSLSTGVDGLSKFRRAQNRNGDWVLAGIIDRGLGKFLSIFAK